MPLWGLFKSMTGIGVGSKLAKKLYGRIVTQARISLFYEKLGVPDTFEGRIDMLALHVFMALEIMRETPSCEKLSQDLVNILADDIEVSLREMGVGDLSVGKKVQNNVRIIYGRLQAYQLAWRGVEAQNPKTALEAVILRNVFHGQDGDDDKICDQTKQLAAYVFWQMAKLATLTPADLARGRLKFADDFLPQLAA